MQKTTETQRFWIFWFLLCLWFGHFKTMTSPPAGMHQGAQCDRACVAWNYYSVSMNFFEPRVSEIRGADGVAGLEFPVIQYSVALLYKVLGPHDWIYRAIMFILVSMGVFAAWKICSFFIQRELHRLLVTFGWYSSPVLGFYTNSFLPDPAALALSMLAIWFILRWLFGIEPKKSFRYYLFFITLAALIKVSFLIVHFSVFILLLSWRWLGREQTLKPETRLRHYLSLLIPLIPVAAWYKYSSDLTARTWNTHFLQKANPAASVSEFIENTRYAFSTWGESLYTQGFLTALLVLFLLTVFMRFRHCYIPAMMGGLLLGGFAAAFILFNRQFRFHDYYFVLMMPGILFAYIFIQQVWLENRSVFIGILPAVVLVGFWYFSVKNMFHASEMLEQRYTAGNYYFQNAFDNADKLPEMRTEINKHIPPGKTIVFAFDPTPNTGLYQLRRRGIRISRDFKPEMTASIIHDLNAEYLLVNDSTLWAGNFARHLNKKTQLLWNNNGLWVYGLK